ncbi:MAG: hypothetical protein EON93_22920 [Burkholderiales bacterium]|nr:MAG: hypothetical protein EON93_22920 [Burkholderiales bacterium]
MTLELAVSVPAEFPGADHPFFERVVAIPSRFDRLIVYRASILHSPAIAPHAHFSRDPRKGRLTVTAFLNPKGEVTNPDG